MASKEKLDKNTKKAILIVQKMIGEIAKADSNEAETRKYIDHILETLTGYDRFKHITQEYAISGVGNTVHCDFVIQLDRKDELRPDIVVEIKRVGVDLVPKHLRQAASYAINIGCEWLLLTNSKEWRLYHVSFTQPPQTKLIDSWNIIDNDPATLAKKFNLISYRSVKKDGLAKLWEKRNVLTPQNLLKVILSEQSLKSIRREIKKATDVTVSPEEIVGAIRHMLNEAAVGEMEKIRISLPEKKQPRKATPKRSKVPSEEKQKPETEI